MAEDERVAIGAVIRDYLDGMIYGQYDRLEGAMHPKCMVAGHFGGSYDFMPRDAFIATLKSMKAEIPAGTPYVSAIAMVDITGDTAVAKVTDDCFGTSFTDYLTLIKDQGRWQIVNKAFYDHAAKAT
jgi:hypothetical protein